jgi:hypothetical protein
MKNTKILILDYEESATDLYSDFLEDVTVLKRLGNKLILMSTILLSLIL